MAGGGAANTSVGESSFKLTIPTPQKSRGGYRPSSPQSGKKHSQGAKEEADRRRLVGKDDDMEEGDVGYTRGATDEDGDGRVDYEWKTLEDDPNPLRMGSLRNFLVILFAIFFIGCLVLLSRSDAF